MAVTALIVVSFAALTLTGCHTAAGFGEDIESLGRGLRHAAGD
jgi:predicted small secreted protein